MTERPHDWMWIPAELLLVCTTIAGVLTFERIFDDRTFLAPLIFSALVAHGLLIALRWIGFSALVSGLVSFLGTLASIVAIHYSDTALLAIIPTGGSIDQLSVDMTQAQQVFQALKAPVPAVTGFLVIASIGLWIAALLADWAAFRLRSPGQALLPSLALIIFVSLLGLPDRRVFTTGVLVICAVLFVLAARAAERASTGLWLDEGPGRGYTSLMAAGALVAGVAVVLGILGGPELPGAEAAPIVELGDRTREEKKPLEVISPMVQIQPRLIDQSDSIMFTVSTDTRSYWRIAALDEFDGSLWRAQGSFREATEDLPLVYQANAPATLATAEFDLVGMAAVWAPAAYQPVAFTNLSEIGVNYEPESATLIVDVDDQDVSDGLNYVVLSRLSDFTPDLLRRLSTTSNETVDARYLALPDGYSQLARTTAQQITAGLDNPYDQALALQNWFRDNFTYDLDVAKGHDIRRVEDFLTVRRGYCEQFAGTFASMARSIGLPARVAIGFTNGDADPTNPNRFIVRGRHAHAWPEVFIPGAGWVAFEPTPGRGAPNATEYTGVPEAQDSFQPPEQVESEPAPEPQEASEAAAAPTPSPVAQPTPTAVPLAVEVDETVEQTDATSVLSRLWLPLLILASLAAWVLGVPALRRARTRRRHARAGEDLRRRITLAWSTTTDRLEGGGLGPRPSETLSEYAERVDKSDASAVRAFSELTELAVAAAYRPTEPTRGEVDEAERIAGVIGTQITEAMSWSERGVRELNPSDLLRRDHVDERAKRLAGGAVDVLVASDSDKPGAADHGPADEGPETLP